MKQTEDILVAFYRPTEWWGWGIAAYQLLRGVKYWQIVHVEILAPEGVYAYRINEVLHGDAVCFHPAHTVVLYRSSTSATTRRALSNSIHRKWGDFSPLSLVNGNNCVRYCKVVLSISARTTLPGDLLYILEGRCQTTPPSH
jgi:hypothetical protein